jgi:hypothetical protein
MSGGEFSERLEATLADLVGFALCFLRTLRDLLLRSSCLAQAARGEFSEAGYLTPNAFLLSCAIAVGFTGKLLATGSLEITAASIEQLEDVTLTSFLDQSASVFIIAMISKLLASVVLRNQGEARVRRFRQLNYYVIGFFGLGGILVLLLLSAFLRISFDLFQFEAVPVFRYVSYLMMLGYLAWILMLLYRLSSSAFHVDSAASLALGIRLRVMLCSLIIIGLCTANFVRPILQPAAAPIEGQLVDIHETAEGQLQFTFRLDNTGNRSLTINQVDEVTLFAKSADIPGERGVGTLCSPGAGADTSDRFAVLEPGKSVLLTFCNRSPLLNDFLKNVGYTGSPRAGGGQRLQLGREEQLRISARLKFPGSGLDSQRSEIVLKH